MQQSFTCFNALIFRDLAEAVALAMHSGSRAIRLFVACLIAPFFAIIK